MTVDRAGHHLAATRVVSATDVLARLLAREDGTLAGASFHLFGLLVAQEVARVSVDLPRWFPD